MNPVHILTTYFFKSHFNNILTSTFNSSKWTFPFSFPTKIFNIYVIYHIRTTCFAPLSILDLTTLIIFGEGWTLWNSLLQTYSSVHHLVTYAVLGSEILLSTLFSNIFNPCPLISETKFHNHMKQDVQLYFNLYVTRQEAGRQKILNWMLASISKI
jgi:hypothetical protein